MYGIDGGVGEEAGGAGSLEYAQEGQPEQSHPLASRVSHEYDATQRSQVFPLHVAGQLPSTAGASGGEGVGAGSLDCVQEGQPEQSHPLASRVSHEYDATYASHVWPPHVDGQLSCTAGASGGEGVGAGASCGEGVGAGSLDALKHTKRRIDILIRSGPRILCMQASERSSGLTKAQRLFVYFAESISPITVSFCPTTAK